MPKPVTDEQKVQDFQQEKQLVLQYYEALDRAELSAIPTVISEFCAPNLVWRGFHPYGELSGPEAVAKRFWMPLRSSLSRVQRRLDIFMAGQNSRTENDEVWVVSMGHLLGLFDRPWLGIRPTGKIALLRYSAFHKVVEDQIVETAMYFDIPHVMAQAGQSPWPIQTAEHMVQPGPATHGGLLFERQDPAEAVATLASIDAMVKDLGQWKLGLPIEEELARTWHDDMLWWGPEGIGSTYTIERYAKQHAGPFRAAFSDRTKAQHICRMAEGHFGAFFGWPNFTARQTGTFMGQPATDRVGEFRVIDLYRREGDKLAENWIFIDLLHYWKTQGVDVLGQLAGQAA